MMFRPNLDFQFASVLSITLKNRKDRIFVTKNGRQIG